MADICEAAERKAQEFGVRISPVNRTTLSTYADYEQVGFITSYRMESVLQSVENQFIAALRAQNAAPIKVDPKKPVDNKKPVINKKPASPDDDDGPFDLFADKPAEKKPTIADDDDDEPSVCGLFD